ncbi:MAG: hypothetical protein GY807_24080 [Gammaproteobacteria bacterium]|nr:hypothetical protein [Gammaproteobacteria bacterium]
MSDTPNWRKIAFELYRALDDIDTASDIAKGDDKFYRARVRYHHKKRFEILPTPLSDELYDEFYPSDGLMERNSAP